MMVQSFVRRMLMENLSRSARWLAGYRPLWVMNTEMLSPARRRVKKSGCRTLFLSLVDCNVPEIERSKSVV